MARKLWLLVLLAASAVAAQEPEETPQAERAAENTDASEAAGASESGEQETAGVKTLSGMSILGNEEAPKSLVIVPWKSSQLGDEVGVTNGIDERARPVDREVFMRELHYYELRSGS